MVDFVPVGPPDALIDAPGNIGQGDIDGAELSLRLPLQPLLPGGTFTVAGTWRDTDAATRSRASTGRSATSRKVTSRRSCART